MISLTTFPSSEKFSEEEEIDWITLLLFPSIVNLENPASTANSIALRQASNSASSLVLTLGPLTDIATITSPLLFLIIAPKPVLPKPDTWTKSEEGIHGDHANPN